MYGPVKGNELWRIRRNGELEATIKGENIVRFIKSQRIRWLGHIWRMQDTAIPKKDIGKALCNKTKRKTKNEMGGWRVHGPEKDGNKRMERQSKGSRCLEVYCKGGQGPPRAVVPLNWLDINATHKSTPECSRSDYSGGHEMTCSPLLYIMHFLSKIRPLWHLLRFMKQKFQLKKTEITQYQRGTQHVRLLHLWKKLQQNTFNLISENSEIMVICHLRTAVQDQLFCFLPEKSFISETCRSHRHVQ